jgi:hypothetical protein
VNSRHTQGPWTICPIDPTLIEFGNRVIASTLKVDLDACICREANANARLIAKTPEMFAILWAIHRHGLTDEVKGKIAELLAEVD